MTASVCGRFRAPRPGPRTAAARIAAASSRRWPATRPPAADRRPRTQLAQAIHHPFRLPPEPVAAGCSARSTAQVDDSRARWPAPEGTGGPQGVSTTAGLGLERHHGRRQQHRPQRAQAAVGGDLDQQRLVLRSHATQRRHGRPAIRAGAGRRRSGRSAAGGVRFRRSPQRSDSSSAAAPSSSARRTLAGENRQTTAAPRLSRSAQESSRALTAADGRRRPSRSGRNRIGPRWRPAPPSHRRREQAPDRAGAAPRRSG